MLREELYSEGDTNDEKTCSNLNRMARTRLLVSAAARNASAERGRDLHQQIRCATVLQRKKMDKQSR